LVGADVNGDCRGFAIARGVGVAKESKHFAKLRIARELFLPSLAIGDHFVIERSRILADGEPVFGVGQERAARMFPDVVLKLVHSVLIFPGEERAKSDAVTDILDASAFRKFGQIFLVLADRFVLVAGGELGITERIANLLAETALWLGLEDPTEISFRRFWITGLQGNRA